MVKINMIDIVFNDKAPNMIKDAIAIQDFASKLNATIRKIDKENPKYSKNERSILMESEYFDIINKYLCSDYSLYDKFKSECLNDVINYLIDTLKSIHGVLSELNYKLRCSKYEYNDINNNITVTLNDIYGVYYVLENSDDFDPKVINSIDAAFDILYRRLDYKSDKIEAGRKYLLLLTGLEYICMDIIKSLNIEIHE